MPSVIQRSFSGGELSPSLAARADQAKYATGLALCRNFQVMRHGGVRTRSSMQFVRATKNNNIYAKLFSFVFNDDQSYALEIGFDEDYTDGFGTNTPTGYVRVHRDGGTIVIVAAAAWADATQYDVSDVRSQGGFNFYCKVAHLSTTSIEPTDAAGAVYWHKMDANPAVAGGSIYEIPAPWAAADIEFLYPEQSADVVWFTCRNTETLDDYPPYQLVRTAHDDWTLSVVTVLPSQAAPVFTVAAPLPLTGAGTTSGTKTARYVVTATAKDTFEESLPAHAGTTVGPDIVSTVGSSDANVVSAAHGLVTGDEIAITAVTLQAANIPNALFETVMLEGVFRVTRVDAGNFTLDGTAGITYVANSYAVTWAKAYTEDTTATVPPTEALPIVVNWTPIAGAIEYSVYRVENGVAGFVGTATTSPFTDDGIEPDTTLTPPQYNPKFLLEDRRPGIVGLFQQRKFYASSNTEPQTVWGSQIGNLENYTTHSPLLDEDAIEFTLSGRQVNDVRHLLGLREFLILTRGGKWAAHGDADGALTPTTINLDAQGYGGASTIRPVFVQENAIYIQARGSILRDLREELEGYRGRDLTVFAAHLFGPGCNCGLLDMAYAEIPDSIVWCVRFDGVLLGMTYLREHDIWGWHQHNSEDGEARFKSIITIPEGGLDTLYTIIERTVDDAAVRYIERMVPFCGACDE